MRIGTVGGAWTRREALAATLSGGAMALAPLRALAAPALPEGGRINLAAPDGRPISVSDWQAFGRERGLILFSHGALSAPHLYELLIADWVAAGYRVMAPLHVDSAEHPETARYPGLASWKARIEDMHALSAHVGRRPWVAAGHSYGGLVALTMGGAAAVPPEGLSAPLGDANVRVVVAFSPPAPVPVLCTREGYAALRVPSLVVTGTADNPPAPPGAPPAGPDAWRGHLVPFDAAAPGNGRYGLVLEGVDHYFGGSICRYNLPGPRQLTRLDDAKRITRLFLDGWCLGHAASRRRLDAAVTDQLPVQLLHK